MAVDPGNPRHFLRSTTWNKVVDDFFHAHLGLLFAARGPPVGAKGRRRQAGGVHEIALGVWRPPVAHREGHGHVG